MSPRSKRTIPRCPRCGLWERDCLCGDVRAEPVRTRVVVLMHSREARKSSNTGRLLPLLLAGAEVRLRGRQDAPLEIADVLEADRRPLLLDPSAAACLDADLARASALPVTLLVPDGTWRQTRRFVLRGRSAIAGVQRVRLAEGAPSRYRLRTTEVPGRLATLEAVARALGVLEGPEVQARLEAAFDLFIARTLATRGK